jgi:hypothetical protein
VFRYWEQLVTGTWSYEVLQLWPAIP